MRVKKPVWKTLPSNNLELVEKTKLSAGKLSVPKSHVPGTLEIRPKSFAPLIVRNRQSKMSERNLGKTLNKTMKLRDAEQRVISSAERGEFCAFGEEDPSEGANWGEERTVSADVIYALCCGTGEEWPVHAKGVRIRGARIVGTLDFEAAVLRCPLHLVSCFIEQPMCFDNANVPRLALSGSFTQGLQADGMVCEGSVSLREGFSAKGEVRFAGATIAGGLDCGGGSFENPEGDALNADGLDCKGNVFLNEGFSAKGEVRLLGATIASNLECTRGSFENPKGNALSADRLDCKGSVFLHKGFSAKGKVRLLGATIGGVLTCQRGSFENPEGDALNADGLKCKGGVFLGKGFSAKGEVRFLGATIGGNLECEGGSFENLGKGALNAEQLNCKGHVFLRKGFSAKGEVSLFGATISGGLDCQLATFENSGGLALDLCNAKVAGTLRWSGLPTLPKGRVRLTAAQVGSLEDDPENWPEKGSLLLDGFRYTRIEPMDAEMRTQWLSRAPYGAQPYEQLATVLRSHGRQEDAKEILMEKQRARVRHGSDPRLVKLWIWFLGLTIGYGFRPGRAVWWLLALWLFGFGVFRYAERHAMMAPSDVGIMRTASWTENRKVPPKYADYPPFNAMAYSLDTMLPIVNFHMESYWEPSRSQEKSGTWEWAVWWYLRGHIALGWILTTLAVLGFAGLVRQD